MGFTSPLGSPRRAAACGVGVAMAVAALWFMRHRASPAPSPNGGAVVSVRVTIHDQGVPGRPLIVRDRARVEALVAALGVEAREALPCPEDYATADVGLTLMGEDVYGKRDVYVWGVSGLGEGSRLVVSTRAGCVGGATADAGALARALAELDAGGRRAP